MLPTPQSLTQSDSALSSPTTIPSDWLRLNNDELKSLIREELVHRLDAAMAKMAKWRSTISAALHPDHSTPTPETIRAYDIDQLEEYVEKVEMEEQELEKAFLVKKLGAMVARRSGSVKPLEATPSPRGEYLGHVARGSSNDNASTVGRVAILSLPRTQMATTIGAEGIHVDEQVRDLCPPPAPSSQTPSEKRSRKRFVITSRDEEDDDSQITAEPSLPVKTVDVKVEEATEEFDIDISSASPGLSLAEPQQHPSSMDAVVVDIAIDAADDDPIMSKIQRLQAKCRTPKVERATTDPEVIVIEDTDDKMETIGTGQENELPASQEPDTPPSGEAAEEDMNTRDDDIAVKSERESNSPKRVENANLKPHDGHPAYVPWSVPNGLEINSLSLSQVVRGLLWRHFRHGNGGLSAKRITGLCVEYFPEHMQSKQTKKARDKGIRKAVRRYIRACGFWDKAGVFPPSSHGLETPIVQAKPVMYLSPQYYKYLNSDHDFNAQKHLFEHVDTLTCARTPKNPSSLPSDHPESNVSVPIEPGTSCSHRSLGLGHSSNFDHTTLPGAVPIEVRQERALPQPKRTGKRPNGQAGNSHGDLNEIPSTLASSNRSKKRRKSKKRRASSHESDSEDDDLYTEESNDDDLYIEESSDADTWLPTPRRKRVKVDTETSAKLPQTTQIPTVLKRPWSEKWTSTKPMIAYTYWQMWNKLGGDNINTYRNTSFRAHQRNLVPYAALVKDKWNPGRLPQSALFAKDPGQSLPEALQKCKEWWKRTLGWRFKTGAVPVFCNLPKKIAGLQLPASYWLYLGPCYLGDVLAKTPFEELSTASRAVWEKYCEQEDVMVEVEILPSSDPDDLTMEQLVCDGDCVRRAIEVFGDESVGPDKVVLCDCTPGLFHQRHGAQSRQCCSWDYKNTRCECYWRTREQIEAAFYQEYGRFMKKDAIPELGASATNCLGGGPQPNGAVTRDGTPGDIADECKEEEDADVLVKDEANEEDSQDKDHQPNEETHNSRPLFSETQPISEDELFVIDKMPAREVELSERREEINTSTEITVNGDEAPKQIPTNESPSCQDEQGLMQVDKVS
ncbi:uncharacterized protein SPPG_01669 [Spizellomyces punctatus DAOM BR117]|uniref:Uncharacterized protein n=1 Tax=Spizellomyces punctatus (strain DAOM BR117) TaxID=645134 RepID=A0A0L0HT02_SPIPD|nr:uncharacterized protein SPPG_01669 [Spizellomyces punctatus DAOM BR117]KND04238.1 hypothetical protein SPPG_01669 [Spizellomyces punctatus DAOM BR117]|eukprot:XP_016612277.1 hypothetical protein SPPG_01669 [Spizellomyces punctatus DAOM BR117]